MKSWFFIYHAVDLGGNGKNYNQQLFLYFPPVSNQFNQKNWKKADSNTLGIAGSLSSKLSIWIGGFPTNPNLNWKGQI